MNSRRAALIRNFAIEIVLYGILVTIYLYAIINLLGDRLLFLYQTNLTAYAIIALLLVVVQGVLFDWITTFLVERLGLDRVE